MNDRNRIISAAFAVILLTVACGFNFGLPSTTIKTGPTRTADIHIELPEHASTGTEVNLEFIGGELKLAPGARDFLVAGTATYNVDDFEPMIVPAGSSYTVRQPKANIQGVPDFQGKVRNEWDLQLADAPLSLNIKAGAYVGDFELGGLSLRKLTIAEGGSQVTAAFSSPNKVEMSSFTYSTGASKLELNGLANANFEQMTLSSGAGDYSLSFDGDLKRDASVTIDSGMGTVSIAVPQGVNARVTVDAGMSTVNADSAWSKNETLYTLSGSGPMLTIVVKMGVGTLNLKIV